jgi:hypothetical protein
MKAWSSIDHSYPRRVEIHGGLFGDAQFFVESICLGLSTEEVNESLHFVLASTLLENRVAVSATFSAVHRIFLENRVEHVGRVYLRAKVAVVTCNKKSVSVL